MPGFVFVVVGLLTLGVLSRVLGTVFFAITVAYVLSPIRRALVGRGLHRRFVAAVATALGFIFVTLILTPIVYAVYIRQSFLLAFSRSIPSEQLTTVFGMNWVVDVSALVARARNRVPEFAVDTVSATSVLALKWLLFVWPETTTDRLLVGVHTAGCTSVKNFATPGRQISSRSYSRQYQSPPSSSRPAAFHSVRLPS